MSYTKEQIEQSFDYVIQEISNGRSLHKVLMDENTPSSETFYKWIDGDKEKAKKYACACEKRAARIFEEILDIADSAENDKKTIDGIVLTDHEHIQRSKLRVDARKWMLAKMQPKKYGEKLDLTTNGGNINSDKYNKIFPDELKDL